MSKPELFAGQITLSLGRTTNSFYVSGLTRDQYNLLGWVANTSYAASGNVPRMGLERIRNKPKPMKKFGDRPWLTWVNVKVKVDKDARRSKCSSLWNTCSSERVVRTTKRRRKR